MIVNVNVKNFTKEVLKFYGDVLVYFWSENCMPCKVLEPMLKKAAGQNIKIAKVNVNEDFELAERYNVMGLPSFILFKNGKAIDGEVGSAAQKFIENLLN